MNLGMYYLVPYYLTWTLPDLAQDQVVLHLKNLVSPMSYLKTLLEDVANLAHLYVLLLQNLQLQHLQFFAYHNHLIWFVVEVSLLVVTKLHPSQLHDHVYKLNHLTCFLRCYLDQLFCLSCHCQPKHIQQYHSIYEINICFSLCKM